jgi:hypothetical protein
MIVGNTNPGYGLQDFGPLWQMLGQWPYLGDRSTHDKHNRLHFN